jgi:hypothetical protein
MHVNVFVAKMVLGSRTRSTYTALKKSSVYECVYRLYVFNPRKCLNANPILLSQNNNGVLVPVPILQVAFHTLSSSSTALALYTVHCTLQEGPAIPAYYR